MKTLARVLFFFLLVGWLAALGEFVHESVVLARLHWRLSSEHGDAFFRDYDATWEPFGRLTVAMPCVVVLGMVLTAVGRPAWKEE